MLCNVCLTLASRLVQLQREVRSSGSVDGRAKGCSLGGATLPSSRVAPPFEDLVIHFEEYGRLEDKNLKFYFDIAPDTMFFIEYAGQRAYELATRCRLSSSTGSEESMELAAHWFRNCLSHHEKCNLDATQRGIHVGF